MTTKPKAPRYHAYRPKPKSPPPVAGPTDLEGIQNEELTGRQLRMARRVALRHGLTVESDHDAVRQLRLRGIDPFTRSNVLGFGNPGGDDPQQEPLKSSALTPRTGADQHLPDGPQGNKPNLPGKLQKQTPMDKRAGELQKMQQEIARRRRRNLRMLLLRLAAFILLPTLVAGYYFYTIATPMYETKSEFVIQKASGGGSGLGGLLQGTSMATQQYSIAVQAYLTSPAALQRLDQQYDFRSVFSNPDIDRLQRLAPDATNDEAFKVYQKRVQVSYDPTEGLVRLNVSAPSPQISLTFNKVLLEYAVEQVNGMTADMRRDQMQGALETYEAAEAARQEALDALVRIQANAKVLDPTAESTALMSRINILESQRDLESLELASLLNNVRPNQARVDGVKSNIARLDEQIATLRARLTQSSDGNVSQTEITARLRAAEENYQVRLGLVQQTLAQMETARNDVNKQANYLSLSVPPIAPDSPSTPRSFENTAVAFFVFAGIYLLLSITGAILREQVSS